MGKERGHNNVKALWQFLVYHVGPGKAAVCPRFLIFPSGVINGQLTYIQTVHIYFCACAAQVGAQLDGQIAGPAGNVQHTQGLALLLLAGQVDNRLSQYIFAVAYGIQALQASKGRQMQVSIQGWIVHYFGHTFSQQHVFAMVKPSIIKPLKGKQGCHISPIALSTFGYFYKPGYCSVYSRRFNNTGNQGWQDFLFSLVFSALIKKQTSCS
jgi:hypothetical protein